MNSLSRSFLKQLEAGSTILKLVNLNLCLSSLIVGVEGKIRCYRLKQRKRKYSIKTFLHKLGVPQQQCWNLAYSDKGWWRMSLNNVIHRGMNLNWFKRNAYFSLHEAFGKHKSETAVCDIARTVV